MVSENNESPSSRDKEIIEETEKFLKFSETIHDSSNTEQDDVDLF